MELRFNFFFMQDESQSCVKKKIDTTGADYTKTTLVVAVYFCSTTLNFSDLNCQDKTDIFFPFHLELNVAAESSFFSRETPSDFVFEYIILIYSKQLCTHTPKSVILSHLL